MSAGEYDGSDDRQRPVGKQPVERVRDRPANAEQRQGDESPGNDAEMTVTPKSEIQRNDADRYDDDEHFHVQVIVAELAEKRQYHDGKRQQKAMQQAKS